MFRMCAWLEESALCWCCTKNWICSFDWSLCESAWPFREDETVVRARIRGMPKGPEKQRNVRKFDRDLSLSQRKERKTLRACKDVLRQVHCCAAWRLFGCMDDTLALTSACSAVADVEWKSGQKNRRWPVRKWEGQTTSLFARDPSYRLWNGVLQRPSKRKCVDWKCAVSPMFVLTQPI